MELVNICLIAVSSVIMIVWALRKRKEIITMNIDFSVDGDEMIDSETKKLKEKMSYMRNNQDLYTIAEYFQEITLAGISRIHKFGLILILVASILVWLLMEETLHEFAQAIFFFLGAYLQILIAMIVFKNYNFYDPRVIFLARLSKWNGLDFIIKLNSYITILNQGLNLIAFSVTYYGSTCKFITISNHFSHCFGDYE